MSKGHMVEERNVLDELLGGHHTPDDDDDDLGMSRRPSAATVSPSKPLPATVSKTKKFEDALNKMKEKKLAQIASTSGQETDVKKKPGIKISKITSIGRNGPKEGGQSNVQVQSTNKQEYQRYQRVDGRREPSESSTSTSSCSCEDHSDDDHDHHSLDHSPVVPERPDSDPHKYFAGRRSPQSPPPDGRRSKVTASSTPRSRPSHGHSVSPSPRRRSPDRTLQRMSKITDRRKSPDGRRRSPPPWIAERRRRTPPPDHQQRSSHRSPPSRRSLRDERRSPLIARRRPISPSPSERSSHQKMAAIRQSPVRGHRSPPRRRTPPTRSRRSPDDRRLESRKRRMSPVPRPRRYPDDEHEDVHMSKRKRLTPPLPVPRRDDIHRDADYERHEKRRRIDSGNGHEDHRPVIKEAPFHPKEVLQVSKRRERTSFDAVHHSASPKSSVSTPKKVRNRDPVHLIRYFLKDAVYFVMKSNNQENVDIAMARGVWSTPPQNQIKLDRAFNQFKNVLLIFSVKESGRFAGFARLASMSMKCDGQDGPCPVDWILPPGLTNRNFDTIFNLDWICKLELPFNSTVHLFNPLNEGKPVKVARDGQEIDPFVGEQLIKLFPIDDDIDMIPLLKRMKKQTSHRPKKSSGHGHGTEGSERRRVSVFDRLSLPDPEMNRKNMKVVIHSNSNKRVVVDRGD